jgi:hypothetical protein
MEILVRQMGQTFADGISSCGYFYFVGYLTSRREKEPTSEKEKFSTGKKKRPGQTARQTGK